MNLTQKYQSFGVIAGALSDIHTVPMEEHAKILRDINTQIASIGDEEDLLNRQREKEILLSLSKDIALVRNKEELWNLISKKLQPIFGFTDAVVIRKYGKNHHQHFLAFSAEDIKNYKTFKQIVEDPHHNKGTTWEWQLNLDGPHVLYLKDLMAMEEVDHHPGFIMMKEMNRTESFGAPLSFAGEKFGFLWFHFLTDTLPKKKLNLFGQVADQIGAAVSNILANEEILQRQTEKEILLSFSEDISKERNKEGLMGTINQKMKQIFEFDYSVVVIQEEDGIHQTQWVLEIDEKLKANKNLAEVKEITSPIAGTPFEWILARHTPSYFTAEDLKSHPEYPGTQLYWQMEMKKSLVLPLLQGGKQLGIMLFHYSCTEVADAINLSLAENTANQIAVAVSNILANEEILERQRDKEMLLRITKLLGKTRSKDEFWEVMMDEIKPIFLFRDAIVVVSKGQDHHETIAVKSQTESRKNKLFKSAINLNPNENSPYPYNLKSDKPSIVPLTEWEKIAPNYVGAKLQRELGLTESFRAPLLYSGKKFGLLWFHYKEGELPKEKLELFGQVADQVAASISSIIANEEILERQKEKDMLLSISEDIASIRNREDLYKVITTKLQSYIPFDDAVVVTINEGRDECNHLLNLASLQRKKNPLFNKVVNQPTRLKDSAVEAFANYPHFQIIDIEQANRQYPNFPDYQLMLETGLHYSYKFDLKSGGSRIGLLLLHFNESYSFEDAKRDFVLNVVNQISIAVSNILTNEELLQKENIKSLQNAVAQATTSGKDWSSRFESIAMILKEELPFDYISFAIDTKDAYGQGCAFEKIGFDEYRLMQPDQFFKRSGMTIDEYKSNRQQIKYKEAQIFNGKDFIKLVDRDAIKLALSKLYDLNANLNVPIPLSMKGQFQISLYAKKDAAYTRYHLELMKQLTRSLVHPLEKVLALDQVERLNKLLNQEKDYLQEEIKVDHNFEEIVGSSESLNDVFKKVRQVANTTSTVLITGESGTGKELIARAVHNSSDRNKRALIKLNCAALPPQLLESELFGHEKGAFTGADKQRIGKFELAQNSTIFLDEIGEMPVELQAKLLRVLQEKELERIGGNEVIKVNTRVIAATNRNLEKEVAEGNFRSDLYFRLNVFPIKLPPLRERKEDITPLAVHFLRKASRKLGKRISAISSASLKELLDYDWPGNVRELEHVIERAIIVNDGTTLNLVIEKMKITSSRWAGDRGPFQFITLKDAEREVILNTLRFCNGRIRGTGGAAEILDINPATLDSRMKKLGIEKKHVLKEDQ